MNMQHLSIENKIWNLIGMYHSAPQSKTDLFPTVQFHPAAPMALNTCLPVLLCFQLFRGQMLRAWSVFLLFTYNTNYF